MKSFDIRGVIEGFYGKPWTHDERIDMLNFMAKANLNTYFLAPKDEPGHRRKWQELRPDSEIEKLNQLVRHGRWRRRSSGLPNHSYAHVETRSCHSCSIYRT